MQKFYHYRLSLGVFLFVTLFLSGIHLYMDSDILVMERFVTGGAWIEILLVSIWGSFLAYKMEDPLKAPFWRKSSWLLFSVVFFGQFLLGILGFERFLMTGDVHLPVPAMIISGPVYRGELTIMVFLFLSTVLLTGPAWCSHLCYFGGIDNATADIRKNNRSWKNKRQVKHLVFFCILIVTLIFRLINLQRIYALAGGIVAGGVGAALILFKSGKEGKMANCVLYCPVGTLVMYLKRINPFSMYIDSSCNNCGTCSSACNYDALTMRDIHQNKPGTTCTYCGDCLSACNHQAIKYKLFGLQAEKARRIYLFLTVSFYTIFLALAKV